MVLRSLAESLATTLPQFRDYYSAAYEALNLELIKVQIEASVLQSIKDEVLVSDFISPLLVITNTPN